MTVKNIQSVICYMLHVIWKLFLICTMHDIRDKRFQHSRQLLQASEKCCNFALVKPKDVHQPLGWQALLTACEVQSTLSSETGDRCWVLGDGGHYTSVPPPFQNRFKSVPYIEDITAKRKRKKKAFEPMIYMFHSTNNGLQGQRAPSPTATPWGDKESG